LSWSIASLVVGEAIIEGVGAAIMLPATLAIVSNAFEGRERATAFAVWGAAIGVGVALGPVLGGFFTTHLSWRWSFGVNVIVAPLAILGALVFMARDRPRPTRVRIDAPGACLIAAGMFLLVFALSEGSRYGWFEPLQTFTIAGAEVWPKTRAVSVVPLVAVCALLVLFVFYRLERWKERHDRDPLFEFGQLRHRTFRYGLVTSGVLAMGQLGVIFVLPVFLQDAKGLSAATNGLWMLPLGVMIIVGAQLGGYLTRHVGTVRVVQLGLGLSTIGILALALMVDPAMSFGELFVGLAFFGLGLGFSSSQLINVVLSDITPAKSGVASGTNSTVRQVGTALGVALMGSVFASLTVQHAIDSVRASGLSTSLREVAVAGIRAQGAGFRAPQGTPAVDSAALQHALASGITDAIRPVLLLAAGFVAMGTLLSLLIPRRVGRHAEPEPLVEALAVVEPVMPDRAEVRPGPGSARR
jgi:predicted MFS family arabinose efflux permease